MKISLYKAQGFIYNKCMKSAGFTASEERTIRRSTTQRDQQIRYCRICGWGSHPARAFSKMKFRASEWGEIISLLRVARVKAFLLFALFAYFLSLSSFAERRKRENRQRKSSARILKILSRGRGVAIILRRRGLSSHRQR